MSQQRSIFLRAQWRQLLMINYAIDPVILQPRLPVGVEFDYHRGRTFVSLVGFRFLNTRVLGIPVPFHTDFDEINLRFYVKRQLANGEVRRGVVFVQELVPKHLIAWVANGLYNEPYSAVKMKHELTATSLDYQFRWQGQWQRLAAGFSGESAPLQSGSEEEFIFEHYWGYTRLRNGSTQEYQVEHPRWRVWQAENPLAHIDIAKVYGPEFVTTLAGPPSSAFIAEGSEVTVRRGQRLEG